MKDEEDLILWQDVLDEISGGRTGGHACPFCRQGPLQVDTGERGRITVICPNCKKFIEGTLGSEGY